MNFRVAWIFALLLLVGVLGVTSLHMKGLSGLYPQSLILLSLVLLIGVAVKEFSRRDESQERDRELASLWGGEGRQRARMFAFAVVWLLYPFAMASFGFIVTTTLAVALSLGIVGLRRPLLIILASLLFSIVIAILITSVLYIPVPGGPIDHGVDHVIYVLGKH